MVLLIIIFQYFLTGITRWLNGTWLTPAGVNNLLWCFFLTGAWAFQDEFSNLHSLGVFIIFLFCLSFSIGSFIIKNNDKKKLDNLPKKEIIQPERYLPAFQKILILFCILQIILIPSAAYLNFKIPISFFWQPINMIIIGLQVRYDPSYIIANYFNFLLGFNFGCFFLLGAYLALSDITRHKIPWSVYISIFSLIYLGIILVLMFNAKSSMIILFTMAISGYMAFNVAYNPKRNWFRKRIGIIMLPLLVMFSIFIILIIARYSTNDIDKIKNTFITYGFGHVYCFDSFIQFEYDKILFPSGYGINTFFSIAKIFGHRLTEGVYEDMVVFSNGSSSNVFSFLRGYMNDFGLFGFPLISFISSLCIHYFFEKLTQRAAILNASFLALVYQFLFYSVYISPLIYMNILIAYLCFIMSIWIIKRYDQIILFFKGSLNFI